MVPPGNASTSGGASVASDLTAGPSQDERVRAQAKARMVALLAEVAQLSAFLETFDEIAIGLPQGPADERPTPRRARTRGNPRPADVAKAAVEVIRKTGRPMTRREIREGLARVGLVVNGSDPVKTLGTMLWRSGSEQLMQIEGRGYWPKGDPVPPILPLTSALRATQ